DPFARDTSGAGRTAASRTVPVLDSASRATSRLELSRREPDWAPGTAWAPLSARPPPTALGRREPPGRRYLPGRHPPQAPGTAWALPSRLGAPIRPGAGCRCSPRWTPDRTGPAARIGRTHVPRSTSGRGRRGPSGWRLSRQARSVGDGLGTGLRLRHARLGRRRRRRPERLRRRHARRADLADQDLAVDAAALVELDPPRANLALDQARGLQFEARFRHDCARDLAADDRILRVQVALDLAVLADNDGLPRADRAFDAALDPERALGVAVA